MRSCRARKIILATGTGSLKIPPDLMTSILRALWSGCAMRAGAAGQPPLPGKRRHPAHCMSHRHSEASALSPAALHAKELPPPRRSQQGGETPVQSYISGRKHAAFRPNHRRETQREIAVMRLPRLYRATCGIMTAAALIAGTAIAPQPALAQSAATPDTAAPQQDRPAQQGPASVSALAERLLDAAVNISTTQNAGPRGPGRVPMPRLPEGSPFEEYFDEFFNDEGGGPRLPGPGSSLG